ncbi:MAG: GNAT family N-acetyltransferase [Chloroflexi bacterium]|nr:MAG: GNAT family N-acetyltransferase [Chloroflexota bacterium]
MGYRVQREEFGQLEQEWRECLAGRRPAYPFLSPAWLRLWWNEFGAARELLLLSVRQDERLAGILPLMRDGGRLTFAGDTQVCDYMDLISRDGVPVDAVLTALFRALSEEPWEAIELWGLRDDSPTFAALPAVCAELGWSVQSEPEDVCPQISLPGSWEEYLETLAKKNRHELRRKLRKLSQGGEVELEVLEAPAQIDDALDDFVRMHKLSRTEKAEFMTETMERFFRRIVAALAAERFAEMIFLRLGGRRVASVLCFRAGDELLLYNSGYDPLFAGLSVGLLSKALALKQAIDLGSKRFDFLRGAERYKYELGAQDLAVRRCLIRRT